MDDSKVRQIFLFLETWRTSGEVRQEFKLSNSEWNNFLRFSMRGKFLERYRACNIFPHKKSKTFIYRSK